ncbi:MAG: MFS transporter [Chloroflexi bacterium]|nr:MFS transporter [Chloroflexota bacterium]
MPGIPGMGTDQGTFSMNFHFESRTVMDFLTDHNLRLLDRIKLASKSAFRGGRFLLQGPAGWLADHFGRRRTLTLGIGVSLSAVLLMLQVQDVTSFLVFSGLYGAGSAAIWPSIMAFVGDHGDPSARAKTLNIAQLLGLGLGVMVGVTLIDLISYHAAFAACLAFSGFALAFAYRGARAAGAPVERSGTETSKANGVLRRLLSTRLLLLAGIAFLLSIGTTVQAPIIGQYTTEVLHTKMHVLGLMLLAPAAVALFLIVRFGHLADRFGRQVPLIGGLAVAAVCYYALSQTTNPLLAVNIVVIAGLAYAVSIPAWGAAALDATDLGGRGLMLGVLATVQGLGGVVGQAIGGASSAVWGPVAPFKVGAILLVLALMLTVVHLYHHRRSGAGLRVAA